MEATNRFAAAAVALLVVLVLLLAGCSRDGGDDDGGRAGAPGTRGSAPISLTPITEVPGPDDPDTDDPDPDGPDLDGPPTTYDEAVAHVEAATATESVESFQSPTGNLHCRFFTSDPYGVSCELMEGRADPEPADRCPASTGVETIGRIEMAGGNLIALCNTDTLADPADPTLAYGHAVEAGRYSCIIEQIGVTCVAADSRQGFFLARGTYQLFR